MPSEIGSDDASDGLEGAEDGLEELEGVSVRMVWVWYGRMDGWMDV